MTLTLEKNIARIRLLGTLFEGMSNLVTTMGTEEKKSGEIDFLSRFTTDTLGIFNQFADSLTPEELGILMRLLLKLTNQTNNLSKLFELTPDQKISVGKELEGLAKESNSLLDKIRSRISTK